MNKVKRIIHTHWLSMLITSLVLILILQSTTNYQVELSMVGNPKTAVTQYTFLVILENFIGTSFRFLCPLLLIIFIVDKWHFIFESENIKYHLMRMPYRKFISRLIKSVLKIATIFPIILLGYLLISAIISNFNFDISTGGPVISEVDLWNSNHFLLYFVIHIIQLYLAAFTITNIAFLYLNKVKNKILVILFSYITYISLILFLDVGIALAGKIFFDVQLNTDYLGGISIGIWTIRAKYLNYFYYVFFTFLFALISLGTILFLYRKKERIVMQNEKEMV